MEAPLDDTYWVEPARLLAGSYPATLWPEDAHVRIGRLRAAGVTLFLDLTEEHELDPYAHLADGVRHVRMPIRDMGVATPEQMRRTLDVIDRELACGGVVYLHCFGGAGRTGTVVGCWLVQHGLEGNAALERIAALRAGNPELWLDSPQTEAQRMFVRRWDP